MFRAELIAFYDAYCARQDPEALYPPPCFDYADFAVLPRDTSSAVAFWDAILPKDAPEVSPFAGPDFADCVRLTQKLPNDLVQRLKIVAQRRGTDVEAITLQAFARFLKKAQEDNDPWVILPIHDVRPPQAAAVLGQFTRLCPLWTGHLTKDADISDILANLRSGAAMGLDALTNLMPTRVPDRIGYFFEFGPPPQPDIALAYDISLSLLHDEDGMIAFWAVRVDHPQAEDLDQLANAFLACLEDM